MNIVKNQHFVPRTNLKEFNNGKEKQVFVYDKENENCFSTNVSNILAEKFFYDIDYDKLFQEENNINKKIFNILDEKEKPQESEKLFQYAENRLTSVINKIKNDRLTSGIKTITTNILIHELVTIQLMRTNRGRELIFKVYSDVYEKDFTEEYKNFFLLKEVVNLFDEEKECSILDVIYQNYGDWTIGLNNTSIPFITSDEPILEINNFRNTNKNVLIYPLTSNHLLILKKKSNISYEDIMNNEIQEIKENDNFDFDKSKIQLIIEKINKKYLEKTHENKKITTIKFNQDEMRIINSMIFNNSNRFLVGSLDFTKQSYFIKNIFPNKLKKILKK